ncbi:MAG TPA: hypothetical protein VF011_17845 [Terriglobales bacterium]
MLFRKPAYATKQLLVGVACLLFSTSAGWAQSASQDADVQQSQAPTTGAPPAMGQEPPPSLSSDFPPLSGLDEPTLEPNVLARSYFSYGAQVGQSADTNASNSLRRGATVTGITHVLGTAALEKLWPTFESALSYAGGGAFYTGGFRTNTQVHALSLDLRYKWRTGALAIRDRATYLPEGTFGGGFGGVGGALGGLGGGVGAGEGGNRFLFFGQGLFGSLTAAPRFDNLSTVDIMQALSPRSAITLAGGFNLLHFTHSTGGLLIDSQQVTGQAGYDYSLSRRDKVAIAYGYQHFHFPQAGGAGFETNVVQALYGHQISGRMDFLIGAGPQFTRFSSPAQGQSLRVAGTGRASLRYRFPRTSVSVTYDHYTSAASGFFAGATTDYANGNLTRPLGRTWLLAADVGYARNHRLQQIGLGIPTSSYQTGTAGLRLSHLLTRTLRVFASYQFTDLVFNSSFCASGNCGNTLNRHIVTVGLSWHAQPIRLD